MTIGDTIEALGIKEPLSIPNLGSVFWSRSYLTGKGNIKDYPDFQAFINQPWTVHYSIPSHGELALDVKLSKPLRTDEGFENVDIYINHLMGTIERSYTRNWHQQAKIGNLSIPTLLIKSLEELLLEWHGEHLTMHYCLLPGKADPLTISVQLRRCEYMPNNPDRTLRFIAQYLTKAFAS